MAKQEFIPIVGSSYNFFVEGMEWAGTVTKVIGDQFEFELSSDLVRDWELCLEDEPKIADISAIQ